MFQKTSMDHLLKGYDYDYDDYAYGADASGVIAIVVFYMLIVYGLLSVTKCFGVLMPKQQDNKP